MLFRQANSENEREAVRDEGQRKGEAYGQTDRGRTRRVIIFGKKIEREREREGERE